ncbi:cyclophilin-like fold protein [Bacteroides sp.]|uniref:cyclophilin-like fold protein n=1 Tax=Bacteroides sp. TaxID=29523 RepID=UPI00261CFFEC|nr:cyclophilin-like fold protein [Bacteroides sp.]MDD3037801.1 cyclophilin-like fold protein [Bacteroides sp.]
MRRLLIMTFLLILAFSLSAVSCSTDGPIPEIGQPIVPDSPDNGNNGNNDNGNNGNGNNDDENNDNDTNEDNNNNSPMSNSLKITVGSTSFSATLEDNVAANAFKALLPMTVNMSEMNGNEKYYYLSENLQTSSSNPGTIRAGDLMLYGSSCVVLFYESFSTSYSYTRLGHIDKPSGLASALGAGSVTVTFELH